MSIFREFVKKYRSSILSKKKERNEENITKMNKLLDNWDYEIEELNKMINKTADMYINNTTKNSAAEEEEEELNIKKENKKNKLHNINKASLTKCIERHIHLRSFPNREHEALFRLYEVNSKDNKILDYSVGYPRRNRKTKEKSFYSILKDICKECSSIKLKEIEDIVSIVNIKKTIEQLDKFKNSVLDKELKKYIGKTINKIRNRRIKKKNNGFFSFFSKREKLGEIINRHVVENQPIDVQGENNSVRVAMLNISNNSQLPRNSEITHISVSSRGVGLGRNIPII